jgi:hypothetical protein
MSSESPPQKRQRVRVGTVDEWQFGPERRFNEWMKSQEINEKDEFDPLARAKEEAFLIDNSVKAQQYQNWIEKQVVKDINLQMNLFNQEVDVDEKGYFKRKFQK